MVHGQIPKGILAALLAEGARVTKVNTVGDGSQEPGDEGVVRVVA